MYEAPRCIALSAAWILTTSVVSAQAYTTPDEVRAIVAQALEDAQTRSSLTQTAGRAGYDDGFFLQSDDAELRLAIHALVQLRYEWNHFRDQPDAFGFFIPRTRLWFAGTIYDDISFYIRGQFSGLRKQLYAEEVPLGGDLQLDRAWVGVPLAKNWTLRLGMQGSEFTRENDLSPENQLGVDASPTDATFGLGGYQGVRIAYQDDLLRAIITSSSGARNINTSFDDPRNANFALTLKTDWKLAGEWDQYSDFTSPPGSELAVLIGAGVHWENGAQIDGVTDDFALLTTIFELSVEGDGWSIFGSFQYLRNTFLAENDEELDDMGFVLQGSYYVTDRVEPYLRFDAVFPDPRRTERNDEFKTLTAGFNYYPFPGSSSLKISCDMMYMFDDEADSLVNPSNNAGVLPSSAGDQIAVRGQVTLVF